jgi:hypothetical protein
MNEIRNLLDAWANDSLNNISALEQAHQAILLLVDKVEELETQVKALTGN